MLPFFKSILPFLFLALITPAFAGQSGAAPARPAHETAATQSSGRATQLSQKETAKMARKAAFKAVFSPKDNNMDDDTLLILVLTILIPPLGVFLYEGDITTKFWISLLLTFLFWIPGLIYSLLVVLGKI